MTFPGPQNYFPGPCHSLQRRVNIKTNSSNLLYTVSQKNCAKLFLSELRQISTNFDNFWQKDGKEAKIMRGALTFHLTYFTSSHYPVKRRCSKMLGYTTLKVVICNKLSNGLISTQ